MRRLVLIPFILLLTLSIAPAFAQTQTPPPPQMTFALQGLSAALNRPVTFDQLQSWSFDANSSYLDTGLGCPGVIGTPRANPIIAYNFTLVLANIPYNIRVSADGTIIVPCNIPDVQPILTPAATPGSGGVVLQPGDGNFVSLEYTPCPPGAPGYLPPRLTVGQQVRVPLGNTPNRIRLAPNTTGVQIGVFNTGATADVLAGPACDSSSMIVWWLINFNGVFGWTAEGVLPDDYYVDPIASPARSSINDVPRPANVPPSAGTTIGTIPDERTAFNAASLSGFTELALLPVGRARALDFSLDTQLLAVGTDNGLTVFSLPDLAVAEGFEISEGIGGLAFGSNLLAYASTSTGEVGVLTPLSSPQAFVFPDRVIDGVNGLAVAGSRIAVATGVVFGGVEGGQDGVEVFDLITQRRIREINASFYVPDVAFNADGSRLAFIDTSLRIIRADTFAEAAAIPIAGGSTGVVTWQPSAVPNTPNTGLAYADGSSVRLYNTTTNTVQEFSLDEGVTAKALAFSPDGALLAALADDSGIERAPTVPMTLNLFDVQTGDLLLQMEVNDAWSMAFSADGTLLALGEANGVAIYGVE